MIAGYRLRRKVALTLLGRWLKWAKNGSSREKEKKSKVDEGLLLN